MPPRHQLGRILLLLMVLTAVVQIAMLVLR